MVRLLQERGAEHHMEAGSMPLATALFVSVSVLVALCAKHTRKHPETSNKIRVTTPTNNKSPLASPKNLAARISNKAIDPFKKKDSSDDQGGEAGIGAKEMEGDGFGEGGLWQKSILMGEKCRPPEFSGVIYYDSHGNQLPEMPRSPKS
ncbi:uncharacterized protein LOC8269506 [Ricinus communis]|uniref:uncharacterized protein LOC8269506 n=1 Tax=Ricinus communis TaxID=3988 RepID=UPI00201A8DD8|nr:uncharacterized protein LOC8269506 [Ricinus communis]